MMHSNYKYDTDFIKKMILIFLKNLQNEKNQSEMFFSKVLYRFESGFFPKRKQGGGRKSISDHVVCVVKVSDRVVFNHKQITEMLQRLPIENSQVKAGNTSEDLLNEIR